jgi:hypothetical protein
VIGSIFGYLNILFLALIGLRFPFSKVPALKESKATVVFAKYYKSFFILFVISTFVHSYFIWGVPKFHTGHAVLISALLSAIAMWLMTRFKINSRFLVHYIFAAIVLITLLIHLFFPYLV